MVKSIYPSIPMPGMDMSTLQPAVEALRQTVNLIILNGLSPNPNYTPSETAQVFVTYAAIKSSGIVGPPGPEGPQGPPGAGGVPEAPNDINVYGRHQLGWKAITTIGGMLSIPSVPVVSSATFVMSGFGALGLVITPSNSRMMLTMSGNVSNGLPSGETALQMYFGTGTPPVAGAPATGSQTGSPLRYMSPNGGINSYAPFSKSTIVGGLTPGTPYWFDMAIAVAGGSGTIANTDVVIQELVG